MKRTWAAKLYETHKQLRTCQLTGENRCAARFGDETQHSSVHCTRVTHTRR